MTIFTCAASAQERPENRDSLGKFLRGPYITNGFKGNWFIGVAGGANVFSNKVNDFTARVTPALDVTVGKWIVPAFGVRLGYQGLTGSENSSATVADGVEGSKKEKFGFAYLHGDAMFNISNAIGGFREDRVWSFVPYVHGGYMRLYDVRDEADENVWEAARSNEHDNEFAGGFGLLNLIHVHKRVNLTLDVRQSLMSPRFHSINTGGPVNNICATLGLQVLLGDTRWERKATLDDQINDLNDALAAAQDAVAAAKSAADKAREDADAAKKAEDAAKALADSLRAADAAKGDQIERLTAEQMAKRAADAELVTYYSIGKYSLSTSELTRLESYIEETLAADPEHKFYITGSADKGTGSEAVNAKICKLRAQNVRYLLRTKYNVKSENIILKPVIISDKHVDNPKLDRCCLLEKE